MFKGDLVAHAAVRGDAIEVATGPAQHPDIRISAGEYFRAFIAGEHTPAEYAALAGVLIEGDPACSRSSRRCSASRWSFRRPPADPAGRSTCVG
ncbi:hypothetical protein GIS00_24745 [Nakamurella sp. YIM 132087]|uniref:Uncharacterized protein n=1 Tax=Nakamurella alba TaxID=2665158 RepID=A0A7K1FSL1_9ACTN|nr:hypothetical protein [Nakamurella alba]MTD17147.1 hypothetical protein [Nakamurella alba]